MSVHPLISWALAMLLTPSTVITGGGGFEITHRDKTGTSVLPRNEAGSQTLVEQALANLDFIKAEGKGQPIASHCLQCKPINSKTLHQEFGVVFDVPTLLSNGLSAAYRTMNLGTFGARHFVF